ncbi:hypothetical protein [Vibrio variabilis]|uniref:hypothetical protein n=1 Tax=Vibrio variabilis TaxID=990271 RepID=UPI000DD8329D|nr:hypothetical protein [Vibrio variabilis]
MSEYNLVLERLLGGDRLYKEVAAEELGVLHLHSVIADIRKVLPVESRDITSRHPIKGYLRSVKMYFVWPEDIERWRNPLTRDALKREQTRARIAKLRHENNKTLEEMCGYCKKETMLRKIDLIYGAAELEEDKPDSI